MDSAEQLRAQIEIGIESNLKFHEQEYDQILKELWLVLFDSTSALEQITKGMDPSKLPDKEFACLLIFSNCIVDSHASYQLMRQGFHRAAATTARGMLENMALAIAMKSDQTDAIFEQYKRGAYDIPKAVGPATKVFSEIGPLYGILSEKFAHEPYESIGRAFIQNEKTVTLLLVPPIGRNDFILQFILCCKMGMLVSTLGQAIEWAFANYFAPNVFWEIVENNNLKRKNAPSFEAIQRMKQILEDRMKKNPKVEEHPPNKKPGT